MDALTRIISETLRIDEDKITPKTAIHETEAWNSLTHIELIITIEETFHIQFTEDEIVAMTNIEEIRKTLAGRGIVTEQ
jgi:acyl carrier protein